MPDHALPPGTRIAEYRIQRVLGQGGFGITYLAWDTRLDGPVALKEYYPAPYAVRRRNGRVTPASRETRDGFQWGFRRFLDEARTIHRFRHPNVVHVRRNFEANGTAYLAMEYVEGDSLADILKERGRLRPDEWRPILDGLLDGLAHVHSHDYLHRDIKPGNILIRDEDSAPVLIDFGSARAETPDGQYTAVLSRDYAPIEQRGAGKQTRAADLFALGAVSYRVLVGELPPSAFDRWAETEDPIPKLAERVRGADRAWLAALDRCLALRPNDRPESVEKLRKLFRARAPASSAAVQRYRERFKRAKSGNGRVCTTALYEGGSRWELRRWVGRRSSGALMATVFAPAKRGDLSDGPSLFSQRFPNRDDAFGWLLGLDESGQIRKAAQERIESLTVSVEISPATARVIRKAAQERIESLRPALRPQSPPPTPVPRPPSPPRQTTSPVSRPTDTSISERLKGAPRGNADAPRAGSTAPPKVPLTPVGAASDKAETREGSRAGAVLVALLGVILLVWFIAATNGC